MINVDAKVASKCLALRLKKVIHTLVDSHQTANVQGCNIGESVRLVEDLLEYAEKEDLTGIMFSSDFEKAFDSIDHCFMFACLKRFEFGTQFVQWVKTLFKSAQSCVMNNGSSTGYFASERGTRQGDPLSTYLFILAIEVLLICVRDSEMVRGIPVTDKEIKLDAYADDGRFFLKDLQFLYGILDITEGFGTFSSLKLNLQKSEACWIGASRFNTNTSANCIWVNLVNDKIRILGTYISYNKQLTDQYDFVNITTDTKNILSIWRLRGLLLSGRIQVFKAVALSKAVFICTMKPYSKKFVDDLNELQKDFIWRGRKPKIKHTSLIDDNSEGGMKDI